MQVRCPNCKALIEVDEKNIFCPYCNEMAHPDAILLHGGLTKDTKGQKLQQESQRRLQDDDDMDYHRRVQKKSYGGWIAAGVIVVIIALVFLYFHFR